MQDFNNDARTTLSRANAAQADNQSIGSATKKPPQLFSASPVQQNKIDNDQESKTDNISKDVHTIPAPIQQKEKTDKESLDDKSETENTLDFANGGGQPPLINNSSANAVLFSGKPFQRKETHSNSTTSPAQASKNSGNVMAKMEHAFGADFSNVKINTNSSAAKESGALAYTQGNQIDFAPGQYNPESTIGQELLGHELTHVVQQKQGKVKPTGSINGKPLNDDPGLEKEADVMGKKAAHSNFQPTKSNNLVQFSFNESNIRQFQLNDHATTLQRKKNEDTTPVDVDEVAIAKNLIDKGAKNENYITDEVFYLRYPGINRRKLIFPNNSDAEMELVRDWLRIRNKVVRPLLAGKEIPDGDKPKKEKPRKDKPGKEKPKKRKPGNGDPKKDKPKKDKPKKEKPEQDPEKEKPIEIPEGWSYDDYINLLKALAEIGRLSTLTLIGAGIGIASGQAAAFLNLVQDFIHSVERKDILLAMATLARNLTVHANNWISDMSFAFTWLQDVIAGINFLGSVFTGGGWTPIAAGFTAFGLAVNSTISGINVIGDIVVMFADGVVLWHLEAVHNNLPEGDPEKEAYKELLDGYRINFLFDTLGLILDLADFCSGGTAHGEFFEKGGKVFGRVFKVTHGGFGIMHTIANALWGTGANETFSTTEENPVQKKGEKDEEGESNLDVAINQMSLFVQGNDLVSGGIDHFAQFWEENRDVLEATLANLQNDDEAVLEFFQQVQETINSLEDKVIAVDRVMEITNGVKENGEYMLSQIENVEKMISDLKVPDIAFPEIDVADNVVVDVLEDIANAGLEGVEDQYNQYVEQMNEWLDGFKETALLGTAFAKEQVLEVLATVESFEQTMHSFKSFLLEHIAEVEDMLEQAGDPKALMEAALNKMMEILGIEGEMNAETIIAGFYDFKQQAHDMLNRLKQEKKNQGEPVQEKSAEQSEESSDLGSQMEDSADVNRGPFQLKKATTSHNDESDKSPFSGLAMQAKKKEQHESLSPFSL